MVIGDHQQVAPNGGAQEFIRTSSTRWGEASISAGTEERQAMATAERTTGFYLGQPPAD